MGEERSVVVKMVNFSKKKFIFQEARENKKIKTKVINFALENSKEIYNKRKIVYEKLKIAQSTRFEAKLENNIRKVSGKQ